MTNTNAFIIPPTQASYGTLRWPVELEDYPSAGGSFIYLEDDGKLSLTGIPWRLSARDARTVAVALLNADEWLKANP